MFRTVSCDKGFRVDDPSFIVNKGSIKKIENIDRTRKNNPVVLRK